MYHRRLLELYGEHKLLCEPVFLYGYAGLILILPKTVIIQSYLSYRHDGRRASNNAYYDGHIETNRASIMLDTLSKPNRRLYFMD